jgi:Cu+-exporting ATPase
MSQTFTVAGLSCQSCVKHVTGALSALPDVTAVLVALGTPSSGQGDAGRTLCGDEVAAALAEEGVYTLV